MHSHNHEINTLQYNANENDDHDLQINLHVKNKIVNHNINLKCFNNYLGEIHFTFM